MAGGRARLRPGVCRRGSSSAVTASQSSPPSASSRPDELVGLAVDMGRRGEDVPAAGPEVQVVAGRWPLR